MIVEIVTFDRSEGFTDTDVSEDARSTVGQWQANPDLMRKLFPTNGDRVAGICVWPTRAAAEAARDAAWIERFRARTGRRPSIAFWDVFMVINNETREVS